MDDGPSTTVSQWWCEHYLSFLWDRDDKEGAGSRKLPHVLEWAFELTVVGVGAGVRRSLALLLMTSPVYIQIIINKSLFDMYLFFAMMQRTKNLDWTRRT